jgi:hypothetical protein
MGNLERSVERLPMSRNIDLLWIVPLCLFGYTADKVIRYFKRDKPYHNYSDWWDM